MRHAVQILNRKQNYLYKIYVIFERKKYIAVNILLPHPALRHLIKVYVHNDIDFSNPNARNFYYFTPTHKKFIMFYLNNSVKVTFSDNRTELKKDMIIIGPQTKPVSLEFEDKHRMIAIELSPASQFYLLGGLPIHEVINESIDGASFFGSRVTELIEKLSETYCLEVIQKELDHFFLGLLVKIKSPEKIDQLFNIISPESSISELACSAGVSTRHFERICKEKLGMSPKLYLKVGRFSTAYRHKVLYPEKTWTEIAYTCGYYDQMHLIRNFRELTDLTPGGIEQIINRQHRDYTNYNISE